jgi:hypothetical protein
VALRSAWGGMARRVNSDGRSNKRAVHCAGENRLDILPIAVATISRTPHGENTDERGANACSDQRVPQQLSTGCQAIRADSLAKRVQLFPGSHIDVAVDERRCRQNGAIKLVRSQHVELWTRIQHYDGALFGCNVDLLVRSHR